MDDKEIINELGRLMHTTKKPLDDANSNRVLKLYLRALCMLDFKRKGIDMTLGKEDYIEKVFNELSNEDLDKIQNNIEVNIQFPEEFINM